MTFSNGNSFSSKKDIGDVSPGAGPAYLGRWLAAMQQPQLLGA